MTQEAPLCGVFALDWTQVELDGTPGLGPNWLRAGAAWRWVGSATRLDGNPNVLPLGPMPQQQDLRKRARAVAARLAGQVRPQEPDHAGIVAPPMGFVLTDGARLFTGRMVQVWGSWHVVFSDAVPPQRQDVFVVSCDPALARETVEGPVPDVICFAADTLITTPDGMVPVDKISAGDMVQTMDNGPQRVVWVGQSRISGVALRRFPELRPVRFRAHALGTAQPVDDLLVSPGHRLLVRGKRAQAMFNADEVLVAARDLVDGAAIRRDLALHGVTYGHLMLEDHQILFANGVPSESFHPDLASAELLRPHLPALRPLLPGVGQGAVYGAVARRCLSSAEAALLAA